MNDHDNLSQEHRDLIEKSNNRNLVMPEFKVKHFVGNAQITPYAKLKQYIIELNGREMAVESMLYENKKAQLEIELEKEKAAACQSPAQKALHELEIFKMQAALKRSQLRLRDATAERNLFLKVIDDFNNSPEGTLPDGTKLIDVFDDPELCERLERDYWTLRLAKQTAMDMIAYGRAGVGNMDAVVMLAPDQQLEVMKLACDFFVRNEIRTNNLLSQVNQNVQNNMLTNSPLVKQLMFKAEEENVSNIQNGQ
jgi:hypothetical protein